MRKQLRIILSIITLCCCSVATYAATNASMWGSIDQPMPPIQQIEQQEVQVQAQQEAIANEKTICELLSAQTTLTSDTANAAKIRDALTQAYKIALPDYKMFLLSPDAANNLYVKYRDAYIKSFCSAKTN